MKMKSLVLVSMLFAGPLGGALFAQETPFSAELDVGWSTFSLDRGRHVAQSLTVTSVDDRSLGYALRVGYAFTPRWGVEAGYTDAGYMNVRGLDSIGRGWSTNIHVMNWTGGVNVRHAVNDNLTLSGRGGMLAFVEEWGKSDVVRKLLPDQERGVKYYFGAAAEWKLTGRFALTGNIDRYLGNQKALFLSAGLKVGF